MIYKGLRKKRISVKSNIKNTFLMFKIKMILSLFKYRMKMQDSGRKIGASSSGEQVQVFKLPLGTAKTLCNRRLITGELTR